MEAESIQIPIKARGFFGSSKTLKLEATLYRPSREGRFPLVIFNHGSTGPGVIPVSFTSRFEAQSHYFLKRGYAVISPMRRGRGASEGTYSESYGCDHVSVSSGVASAIEDLDCNDFTDLGLTLGPMIMGIILHSTSYTIMFLCLAFTGVINLNYFYFFVRKK
jgi:hypothetical protein